jgi:hypothetical protein
MAMDIQTFHILDGDVSSMEVIVNRTFLEFQEDDGQSVTYNTWSNSEVTEMFYQMMFFVIGAPINVYNAIHIKQQQI